MSILKGDIRLMASQRMADTADGGGKMTGTEIVTGQHNTMFPDISDLDRAFGRFQLRKVFLDIDTPDTDTYYGACVAVLEPPKDPSVAITLFSTGNYFDERASAQDRVERYLARGPRWQGFLYDTQVEGQRAIRLFQRPTVRLPEVGEVFALIGDEGKPTEYEQYVRITKVTSEDRKFLVQGYSQEFIRTVVTCEITDPLRHTFQGNSPTPYDDAAQATAFRETVVADATFYFGSSVTSKDAAFKDHEVWVSNMFTQLVPSARSEMSVVDVSASGVSTTLVAGSSGRVSSVTSLVLGPGKSLFLGNPVMLNTLTIEIAGAATITEKAGQLYQNGTVIGSLTAHAGVVVFNEASPVFGASSTKTISFTPAAAPATASETGAILVDANNRGYAYTFALKPLPSPGSLRVSFKAQNKWYDLYDQGDGTLLGADSSFGSGVLNYGTGSLMLTLGALPDVGTAILFSWGESSCRIPVSPTPIKPPFGASVTENINGLCLSFKVNASGGLDRSSDSAYMYSSMGGNLSPMPAGTKASINQTTFAASWDNGNKHLTADANGVISGDATGRVDGQVVTFMPTKLPKKGDTLTMTWRATEQVTVADPQVSISGRSVTLQLGANPWQGTIRLRLGIIRSDAKNYKGEYDTRIFEVRDNEQGRLVELYSGVDYGSVNYTTGEVVLTIPATDKFWVPTAEKYSFGYAQTGNQWLTAPCNFLKVYSVTVVSSSLGAEKSATVPVDSLQWINVNRVGGSVLGSATRLSVAGTAISGSGAQVQVQDPASGAVTAVGALDSTTGNVTLTSWAEGADNEVTAQSLAAEVNEHMVSHVYFRTPGAPVAPSSVYMRCVDSDGVTHDVTFADSGVVDTGIFHGTFNYEHGFGLIKFGTKVLAAGNETKPWYSPTDIDANGFIIKPVFVQPGSITFNCVTYRYLPLDASILKLDPVRLPSDGRVPIYRAGGIVIVHNTVTHQLPNPVPDGYTLELGRTRLTDVFVRDATGREVSPALWSSDKVLGKFTLTPGAALGDYTQPLTVYDRVEDMAMISDVEISGRLTLTKPLTHEYPKGTTYVSSALVVDDLWSRVGNLFDQATWTNEWSDNVIGSSVSAEFNDAYYPIRVQNRGAVTERFALVFSTSTSYNVIGEHLGFIASGSVDADCSPFNPATNTPFFTIDHRAFGAGWPVGSVIRFNTYGASYPFWVARTILQSEAEVDDDKFGLQLRGNVNR